MNYKFSNLREKIEIFLGDPLRENGDMKIFCILTEAKS